MARARTAPIGQIAGPDEADCSLTPPVVAGDGTLMFEGAGTDQLSRIPLEVAALLEAAEGGDESGR